ncbi:hypothetical protein CEXT_611811 [Caerostris extrusa]|uniref:Uncharacterized protein n=1 Tax=Caerostris extrusa TaxID=172846 RepID=A0AAV4U160_CAEEX|nr:hypothetical protein CEXT_611811 [Caerostris extrusa]
MGTLGRRGKLLPPGLVTECLCEGVKFDWNGRSEMRPGNSAPLPFSINYNKIIRINLRLYEDVISAYEGSLQPYTERMPVLPLEDKGGFRSNAFLKNQKLISKCLIMGNQDISVIC